MEFTDFLVWVKGGQVIEFRHSAESIQEFCLIQEDLIFDIYDSQSIRRSEIRMVRLDPRPYFNEFYKTHRYFPWGYTQELWKFINSYSKEEQARVKRDYYKGSELLNG